MRLRTATILATAALGLAIPAAGLASQSTTIGPGKKSCVPAPGADCRGVVERWTVEYHGNLRKAKFTGAVLHGADLRGADLRGADFRGAKLQHADFRGAKLRGARFDAVKRAGKVESGNEQCAFIRSGAAVNDAQYGNADLSYANFTGADLTNACFADAKIIYATLTSANFTGAMMNGADIAYSDLTNANFTNANLAGAYIRADTWSNTTCPDGTVINTGLVWENMCPAS